MPPKKGDVGAFAPARGAPGGRPVGVLEIVDADDAIIRAWYATNGDSGDGQDASFIDLWLHGVDTGGMQAGSPVELTAQFHVTGTRSPDTACGGRSFLLLEPFDRR